MSSITQASCNVIKDKFTACRHLPAGQGAEPSHIKIKKTKQKKTPVTQPVAEENLGEGYIRHNWSCNDIQKEEHVGFFLALSSFLSAYIFHPEMISACWSAAPKL